MFVKGTMKDEGIDVTIKNNPDHVLAPNNWDMVLDVKFGKISTDEYKTWYHNLIRERWKTRQKEIMDLAREGKSKDIVLKCFCPKNTEYCHALLAAEFMNALVKKLG